MFFGTIPGDVLLDIVAIAVVGYLAIRQLQVKQMRVSRLWVLPALTLLFTYTGIQGDLFDTMYSPTIIGVAFLIGMAIGAVRGAATKLTVDAKTQSVTVKGTLLSVILWVVTLGVKGVADFAVAALGAASSIVGLTTALVTAALLALSLGAIIATRVYYYWRYALSVA
ncbi:MAG TPA: hypothetical protein VF808_05410 [Ktedonobacterales bacterium]